MPYAIDNPGGGDCGFYALAIGLIEKIQKEVEKSPTGKSALFETWQENNINGVTLDQIKQFPLLERAGAEYNEMLDKLQQSLRKISVETAERELLSQIQDKTVTSDVNVNNHIFQSFSHLVNQYLEDEDADPTKDTEIKHFNSLIESPEVLALAKETAATVAQRFREDNPAFPEQLQKHIIAQALTENVYEQARDSLKSDSFILKAYQSIKQKGTWWATHENLCYCEKALGVKLGVVGSENGELNEETISLVNRGNNHWVTALEGDAPRIQAQPKQASYKKMSSRLGSPTKTVTKPHQKEIDRVVEKEAPEHQVKYRENIEEHLAAKDEIHKQAEEAKREFQENPENPVDFDNMSEEEQIAYDEKYAAILQDEEISKAFKP